MSGDVLDQALAGVDARIEKTAAIEAEDRPEAPAEPEPDNRSLDDFARESAFADEAMELVHEGYVDDLSDPEAVLEAKARRDAEHTENEHRDAIEAVVEGANATIHEQRAKFLESTLSQFQHDGDERGLEDGYAKTRDPELLRAIWGHDQELADFLMRIHGKPVEPELFDADDLIDGHLAASQAERDSEFPAAVEAKVNTWREKMNADEEWGEGNVEKAIDRWWSELERKPSHFPKTPQQLEQQLDEAMQHVYTPHVREAQSDPSARMFGGLDSLIEEKAYLRGEEGALEASKRPSLNARMVNAKRELYDNEIKVPRQQTNAEFMAGFDWAADKLQHSDTRELSRELMAAHRKKQGEQGKAQARGRLAAHRRMNQLGHAGLPAETVAELEAVLER